MPAKNHNCPDGSQKSHVGMLNCIICHEPSAVLLDRRLKNTLCRNMYDPREVCTDCRKKYLTKGIMLINPETGSLIVVTEDFFTRNFKGQPIPKGRIGYAHEETVQGIMAAAKEAGIPVPGIDG